MRIIQISRTNISLIIIDAFVVGVIFGLTMARYL